MQSSVTFRDECKVEKVSTLENVRIGKMTVF